MCNPGNVPSPQPSHMSNFQDLPNTEAGDNGGVHINSGIPNKAACLARNALDATKLGRVWMQALKFHLGNSSTFADMVSATATACGEAMLSAADCDAVANAWVQVGLGAPAMGGNCPANATLQNGSCFCNTGYRPAANGTCEQIPNVSCPANSHAEAGECYCDQGYVPNMTGDGCASGSTQCSSHSHRENGTCVCDECFQGNPNGSGNGCDAIPNCAVCTNALEESNNGQVLQGRS